VKIVLVPCVASDWQAEGRLLGRVELGPVPGGEARAAAWATSLREVGVEKVLHGPDELCTATGRWLAAALDVKARGIAELAEVDLGLWAGLTDEQLAKRFASAHHELCEAPLNVTPPEGESLAAAHERLEGFLRSRVRRYGKSAVALVVRPLSLAILHQILSGAAAETIWHPEQTASEPLLLNLTRRGEP
jgi:broad specificity phosphatase PhoE